MILKTLLSLAFLAPFTALAANQSADNFLAYSSFQCFDPGNRARKVMIQSPSLASSWTMTLPSNGGTANYFLQTNGSGVTTWAAPTSGVTTMGAFGGSSSATGATISGTTLTMTPADGTNPGGVTTGTQSFAGAKSFSSSPTFSTMTLGSILFSGTSGILSQDNSHLFYDSANTKLTLTAGSSNIDQLCIHSSGSTSFCYGTTTGYMFMESGSTVYDVWQSSWHSFGAVGALPKYSFDFNQSASSTAPLTDIIYNSPTYNLPVIAVRNLSNTTNEYSAVAFSGGNSTQNPTVALVSTFENLTPGSEAGHFDINVTNAGTPSTRLSLSKTGALTLSGYGAGCLQTDASGVVTSNTCFSGTVTAVSVASANGFAGTSSGGATPALTLSTSVTGMVKGNGTALSAATSGTDYQAPISTSGAVSHQFVTAFTAPNTFSRAQPAFTDISGTATVSQTTIGNQAQSTCNTAATIDWSTGNSFTMLLTNGATCAVTFSNAVSGQTITIDYTQPASTGSALVSYATTVKWGGGSVPVMSTGASATDSCTFKYNGTDYRGSCVQAFQ